jgi:lipopolysaccharide cholinephosphotransferase
MRKLTINEIQNVSVGILKKIDEICNKLNLKYGLAYGTLIGAVRHKGFIPWDDDVDIMMPRRDYELLIDYFEKNKKKLMPYELFNYRTNEKYPYMICRISDSRYELDVENEDKFGLGVFVDIYPLDGAGNTVSEYTKLKNQTSMYVSMCFLSTRKRVKRENTKSFIKYILKYPAFFAAKMIGKDFFMKKLEVMARKYDYNTSTYVGCIVWASDDGVKGIIKKEWFENFIDIEFAGYRFKAPKEYDKILSRCYGNYMELPPKKDRIAHHYYDAYKKG